MNKLNVAMIIVIVSMTVMGSKQWCTVNTQWEITECLYDTQAECERCAFVDGQGGLHVKEYCIEVREVHIAK